MLAITVSNVFSEISFSKAIFLKLSFHLRKPDELSESDGVKIKNININK
jgi:hypothetical protein